MPGHASSLRKHDRKADDEWERTREFPLAEQKVFYSSLKPRRAKIREEGKDNVRMRMMAGVWPGSSESCRQERQLGAWACCVGEWMEEIGEELTYLGLKHHGCAVDTVCANGTAPSSTSGCHSGSSGTTILGEATTERDLQTFIWAPRRQVEISTGSPSPRGAMCCWQ